MTNYPLRSTGGPKSGPEGLDPSAVSVRFRNRTGVTLVAGDHVAVDLRDVATESTTFAPEKGGVSVWGAGVDPAGTDLTSGIFLLVTEGGADNAICKGILYGIADARMVRTAGTASVVPGAPLVGKAKHSTYGPVFDADVLAGEKIIAKYNAATASITTTAPVTKQVIFDGWSGFGSVVG